MMARASYGAHEGTYYYEVKIPKHKGNLRFAIQIFFIIFF